MPEARAPERAPGGSPQRHGLQRASTALLRALFTGTALLGLLFTPPLLSLVLAPVLAGGAAALLALFVRYLQDRWPTRQALATAAAVTLALLPFGHAVLALQAWGRVIALLVLVLLIVAAISALTACGQRAPRISPSHLPRGADVRLRELLQVLPLRTLLAEWRALSRLQPYAPVDAVVAVELRSLLLDELQHRDPAAFSRWLSSGAASPPDEHFRDEQEAA